MITGGLVEVAGGPVGPEHVQGQGAEPPFADRPLGLGQQFAALASALGPDLDVVDPGRVGHTARMGETQPEDADRARVVLGPQEEVPGGQYAVGQLGPQVVLGSLLTLGRAPGARLDLLGRVLDDQPLTPLVELG